MDDPQWEQRRVSASGRTLRWPRALLVFALINLTWEIIKANLNEESLRSWPWRLTVLDASTCAAVVALLAGIIVTRTQLSQTMQPVLSWSGFEGHSDEVSHSQRTVTLANAGGGRAVVRSVTYRIQASPAYADSAAIPSGWVSWDNAVTAMDSLGLTWEDDYFILHLGPGGAVPMTNTVRDGTELLALNPRSLERLTAFDIRVQVRDALGDVYERDLQCVRPPSAANRIRRR
ncbi:hypothetical protein ACWC1D_33095 [Streptomyces sp. NPDC001478]